MTLVMQLPIPISTFISYPIINLKKEKKEMTTLMQEFERTKREIEKSRREIEERHARFHEEMAASLASIRNHQTEIETKRSEIDEILASFERLNPNAKPKNDSEIAQHIIDDVIVIASNGSRIPKTSEARYVKFSN